MCDLAPVLVVQQDVQYLQLPQLTHENMQRNQGRSNHMFYNNQEM